MLALPFIIAHTRRKPWLYHKRVRSETAPFPLHTCYDTANRSKSRCHCHDDGGVQARMDIDYAAIVARTH